MGLLNKERAIKLFSEEAILVGTSDVIPEFRMREIFGDAAVDFAKRLSPDSFNGYGNGSYTMYYGTLIGFQIAATYNNVTIIERRT